MKFWQKRLIADPENPLWKKAHPVILGIFCRGVLAANPKQLMLGATLSIITSPIGWVTAVALKSLHLLIVIVVWWLLRGEIAAVGVSENMVLILGILAVLYKDLYAELLYWFLNLLVLTTGGGFLRWMCAGYLSDTAVWRPMLFKKEPIEGLIATMIHIIPNEYRDQYDQIMNLYLDSNNPESETSLGELLDQLVQQKTSGSSA